jgi:mannose/fructose-specific phosphotransferase system component IIA
MRALIITHANLGQSLVECITMIQGSDADLETLSNSGLSKENLIAKINLWLDSETDTDVIIFTDFVGSSCYTAARTVAATDKRFVIQVLAGTNMPMLLTYANSKDRHTSHELVEIIRDRAQRGIK